MNLNSLKPAENATKLSKRVGRGQGSGKGGTSTRGHKGAQSRSGYSRKIGFEGGQMPIYRIMPKRGFKNINRVEYSAVNIGTLQTLAETKGLSEINPEVLRENGLTKKNALVKVLGRGELKAGLKVTAHAFSETAKNAIVNAGGQANVIGAETPAAE
ncbi:MAG: 50S ribosomal protein L15 [Bacteroidales bacterium]|nr:50S ribosomal protein L15 [Bacteroidales bacterium]